MKLLNLITATTVALTGMAAATATPAAAGLAETTRVETIYNTAEFCPGLPDGMPVPANVRTVTMTNGNGTMTQRTILKAFCF